MDQNEIILELLRKALAPKAPDYIGDLIKIGLPILGTVLGGFVGFLSAWRVAEISRRGQMEVAAQTHLTELKKELGGRRANRFEEMLSKIDIFSQRLTSYVTSIKNALGKKGLSAAEIAEIEKHEKQFSNSFLDLLTAESRLLALGHLEVQQELRKFGESAQELFQKVCLKNTQLTVGGIEEDMRALRKQRHDLIASIGKAESNWWVT